LKSDVVLHQKLHQFNSPLSLHPSIAQVATIQTSDKTPLDREWVKQHEKCLKEAQTKAFEQRGW